MVFAVQNNEKLIFVRGFFGFKKENEVKVKIFNF